MEVLHPRAACLDMHKDTVVACVRFAWRLEYFRFNLTFPLPRPTTQNHDLMSGRAGERAGDGMQLVAKRL